MEASPQFSAEGVELRPFNDGLNLADNKRLETPRWALSDPIEPGSEDSGI